MLEKIIKDALQKAFKDYERMYEHETELNTVPYGDTYVTEGEYVTERSAEECVEDFKAEFEPYEFAEKYLLQNREFLDKLEEMKDAERY